MKIIIYALFIVISSHLLSQNVYYGLSLNASSGQLGDKKEILILTKNSDVNLSVSGLDYTYFNFGIGRLKNYKHYFFSIFQPGFTYNDVSFNTAENSLGYNVFDVRYWNFNTSLKIGNHIIRRQFWEEAFTIFVCGGINLDSRVFAIKETASNDFIDENPKLLNKEFSDVIYPSAATYNFFYEIGMFILNYAYLSFQKSFGHSASDLMLTANWALSVGIYINPFKNYTKHKIYTE